MFLLVLELLLSLLGIVWGQSAFTQDKMQCPAGFREELFVFNQPFSLTEEQNQIFINLEDRECFRVCKESQYCVAAVFESQDGRCALANIQERNIDLVCEEFNDKATFDKARQMDVFNCSRGCQAMKKVCNKCGGNPLSVAVASVFCRRAVDSVLDYCLAEELGTLPTLPSLILQESAPSQVSSLVTKPTQQFKIEVPPSQLTQQPVLTPAPVNVSTKDLNPFCCFWARIGECDKNPYWMRPNCPFSCGTPGCTVEQALACQVSLNVEACSRLLVPVVQPILQTGPQPKTQQEAIDPRACSDLDPFCRQYAAVGHCIARSKYIEDNCKVTCKYC